MQSYLKPKNVLIDKDGYTTIVDLGFAKIVRYKTFTLCGTPWYILDLQVTMNRLTVQFQDFVEKMQRHFDLDHTEVQIHFTYVFYMTFKICELN